MVTFIKNIKKGLKFIGFYINDSEIGIKFGNRRLYTKNDGILYWEDSAVGVTGIVSWNDIPDKPNKFIPKRHTHKKISDFIANLQDSGTWTPTTRTTGITFINPVWYRIGNLVNFSFSFQKAQGGINELNISGFPFTPKNITPLCIAVNRQGAVAFIYESKAMLDFDRNIAIYFSLNQVADVHVSGTFVIEQNGTQS